ncbi:MAG: HU family DNA-binding protein [Planctomycetota bacterium]
MSSKSMELRWVSLVQNQARFENEEQALFPQTYQRLYTDTEKPNRLAEPGMLQGKTVSQISKTTVREKVGQSVGMDSEAIRKVLLQVSELIAQNSDLGVLVDGFGEFKAIRGEARQVRNPATGETINAPGQIQLTFEPDTSFHESAFEQPITRNLDLQSLPCLTLRPNPSHFHRSV